MASSLSAVCYSCGFDEKALFGAFRFAIEAGHKQCIVPAINIPTGKLDSVDIYDKTKNRIRRDILL